MAHVRTGCNTWSALCSFLAGIFFTCIVLIIQQRSSFPCVVDSFFGSFGLPIEAVAVPLGLTFVFYMFAAISYADAVGAKEEKAVEDRVRTADSIGMLGFVFTFFSLFAVLLLIGFAIAVIEAIVAFAVFVYLVRHR